MKPGKLILIVGVVSLIISIISRITMIPLPPVGLQAEGILQFASACFLLSIALSLIEGK